MYDVQVPITNYPLWAIKQQDIRLIVIVGKLQPKINEFLKFHLEYFG